MRKIEKNVMFKSCRKNKNHDICVMHIVSVLSS